MKLLKPSLAGVVILAALWLRCINLAGTTDETETTILATLSGTLVDGIEYKPAPQAMVRLLAARGTGPGTVIDSTLTSAAGRYSFDSLKADTYSIAAEYLKASDTLFAVRAKISLVKSTDIGTDTLKAPGTICGSVRIRGLVTRSGVFCYIPGTSYLAITDTGGAFSVFDVPPGSYHFSYMHPKCRDTSIAGVVVRSKRETLLPEMALTVIPDTLTKGIYGVFNEHFEAIRGLEVMVAGDGIPAAHPAVFPLDWNPLSHGFSGYVRVPDTGNSWTATVIVYDTLGKKTGFGRVGFTRISSNILVPVFDPRNATPRVNAGIDRFVKTGDTAVFSGMATDSFGGTIVTYRWDLNGDGNYDVTSASNDTVRFRYTASGLYTVRFSASDNDGNESVDTLMVTVGTFTFTSASAGDDYSLFRRDDNTVWGCGDRYQGKLGDSATYPPRLTPVVVLANGASAYAGTWHSAFITMNGSLYTSGMNDYGQLGNGVSGYNMYEIKPVFVAGSVVQAALGDDFTVFLKSDNTVWGCGRNDIYCQLGIDTIAGATAPVKIFDSAIAIAAGTAHTLALKRDSSLWAWGNNRNGQIGNGRSGYGAIEKSPQRVMNSVKKVAAGWSCTMIIRNDNTLWACGSNVYGQLGNGNSGASAQETIPVQIMSNVASVSSGKSHTMIVKTDHSLWACGDNTYGQLGNGTTVASTVPVKIMDNVASVSAGSRHTLIIKTDGSIWACGDNSKGELGIGSTVSKLSPVQLFPGR